ncbi:MAG: ABC transporter ATP-binding protein [Oscillospiraceae bacterium]|jgi:ABC-2 type transport system ATP-binding protein|nr:ABC transporter ATP-binding protein [Oscillospiraceae bacterium]
MIEVTGLTKSYGKSRGIDNISFSIPEGQIVGFLGPNGAGKTTTMNIITGYLSAGAGDVKIAGIDVLENPLGAKRHIGYLPEQPPLYPGMTVEEYLDFAYELKGVKSPDQQEHIGQICDMTGLSDVYRRVIGHLSKGYKQRVGLAQALIGDPDVLILDEPTVGLDPRQIVEIRGVIKEMGKSRTIILSTHILPEVSAVCERVLVISAGVIVADDKPENLAGSVGGERTLVVRVAGPKDGVQSLLRGQDGVQSAQPLGEMESGSHDFLVESKPNLDIRKPLFAALAKAGYPILMLRPQDASLEDIFLKLTEEELPGSKPSSPGSPKAKRGEKKEDGPDGISGDGKGDD